jgi:hypothetical protein
MFPADLNDPEASSVELGVLIAYLDEIVGAIDRRNRAIVPELLRQPHATHLPREVREELALFAAQSASGFRAPIRFLRYRYRMLQLSAGEGALEDPQLELELGRGRGWASARDADQESDEELSF